MRGIIFDLDDTLYPRERFIHSGMAAVSRHVEQAWKVPADVAFATLFHATTHGRRGMEFQELCQRHSLPAEALPGLVQVFRSHLPNLWPSHGAVATLQALRANGWRIAILTNGLPHVQAAKIRALGLRSLVDHIVYAEEYAEGGKPARGPFLEVLRRLGTPAEQCVCVGDDPRNDIQGARALGMRTIRVARSGVKPAADQEADAVVHMVTDVPARAATLVEMVTAHVA